MPQVSENEPITKHIVFSAFFRVLLWQSLSCATTSGSSVWTHFTTKQWIQTASFKCVFNRWKYESKFDSYNQAKWIRRSGVVEWSKILGICSACNAPDGKEDWIILETYIAQTMWRNENLYDRGRPTAAKRVTSSGIQLRDLAPGQHSSEETSQRWRHCSAQQWKSRPHATIAMFFTTSSADWCEELQWTSLCLIVQTKSIWGWTLRVWSHRTRCLELETTTVGGGKRFSRVK